MWCGIFVGGRGTRMGGIAKGLLTIDGEALVVRLARHARDAGLEPVWVGLHDDAYRAALPGLREIADQPAGIGPLGGLAALLSCTPRAIAVACDMPFVSPSLLQRLCGDEPAALVLAAKSDGYWEPLCARYDASILPTLRRAIAGGTRSFQQLFAQLPVQELFLESRGELRDWDCPDDVR